MFRSPIASCYLHKLQYFGKRYRLWALWALVQGLTVCLSGQTLKRTEFFTTSKGRETLLHLKITIEPGKKGLETGRVADLTLYEWRDLNRDCRITAKEKKETRRVQLSASDFTVPKNSPWLREAIYLIDTLAVCSSPNQFLAAVVLPSRAKQTVRFAPNSQYFKHCDCNKSLFSRLSVFDPLALIIVVYEFTKGGASSRHAIYRHNLNSNVPEQLVYDAKRKFYDPRLCSNGSYLVYTAGDTAGRFGIEVLNLAMRTTTRIGEATFGTTSPRWLDDTCLVFIRDKQLEVWGIDGWRSEIPSELVPGKILYGWRTNDAYSIVYLSQDSAEYRQIEFDRSLKSIAEFTLAPDVRWNLMDNYSPSGDTVLMERAEHIGDTTRLYFYTPNNEEYLNTTPVFPVDERWYYDPFWDRKGGYIVFVTDR